jgi:hypothetical protein
LTTTPDSPFRIQINPASPLHIHRPKAAGDGIIASINGHDVELTFFLFRHDPRFGELYDRAIGDLDMRQIATFVVIMLQARPFGADVVRGLGGD